MNSWSRQWDHPVYVAGTSLPYSKSRSESHNSATYLLTHNCPNQLKVHRYVGVTCVSNVVNAIRN